MTAMMASRSPTEAEMYGNATVGLPPIDVDDLE